MTFQLCILTTAAAGTPHLDTIQAANPDLQIHVHTAADPETEDERMDAWRNCDRNIREWWKANGEAITAEWMLFFEWDVFANVDLAATMRSIRKGSVGCAKLLTPVLHPGWLGWKEIDRLPREIQGFAIGMEPSAVLALRRDALEEIAHPDYDEIFAQDIISELRLGTVARSAEYQPVQVRGWQEVGTLPRQLDPEFSGIIHPIKSTLP
jgi:hypothetical protein